MLPQDIVKTDTITYNHIVWSERCPRKVASVRTQKHLDQVLFSFEMTCHLMYELIVFHHRVSASQNSYSVTTVEKQSEQTSGQKKAQVFSIT